MKQQHNKTMKQQQTITKQNKHKTMNAARNQQQNKQQTTKQ